MSVLEMGLIAPRVGAEGGLRSSAPAAAVALGAGVLRPTLTNRWVERSLGVEVVLPGADEKLGIGPLNGTVRADLGEVQALLAEFLGEVVPTDWGNQWYAHGAKVGPLGARVYWSPRLAGAHRRTEVLFEITQSACDALGFARSCELARRLAVLEPHWTRLDAHWDDHEEHQTARGVFAAFTGGQHHGRVKKARWMEDTEGGECVWIGSRKSGKLLRVYNAVPMHGEGSGVRWELETRREHAAELVDRLLLRDDDTPLADVFWATVRGHVDFVDRPEGATHGERFELLSWWAALVAEVPRVPMKLPRVPQLLENKLRWLADGVSPTIALVLAAMGGDEGGDEESARVWRTRYVRTLIRGGAERVTVAALALIPKERRPTVRLLAQMGSGVI